MPNRCCVINCQGNYAARKNEDDKEVSKKNSYIPVFKFPAEDEVERRKKWVNFAQRQNWAPSKYSVICIRHFDERYIDRLKERVYLKPCAVPTKHCKETPQYLNKKEVCERTDPSERKAAHVARHDEKITAWLNEDNIDNFTQLKESITQKCKTDPWNQSSSSDYIVFYLCDFTENPKILVTVKIDQYLVLDVYIEEYKLKWTELTWILPSSCKVTKYSQIENILSRYKEPAARNDVNFRKSLYEGAVEKNLDKLINIVESETNEDTSNERKQLTFLEEQFGLIYSKSRRYSINMLIWTYMIFLQSPSAYSSLRATKYLILPNMKYLKQLSSSYSCSANSEKETKHFLRSRMKTLCEREHIVALQLDEIHVKPRCEYKSGKISGFAENESAPEGSLAKTVQTFLISSVYGHFKEVVRLHPVLNMTADDLYELTKNVINFIQSCGFHVLVVISDNLKINGNMFEKLLPEEIIGRFWFFWNEESPHRMFLTFDSVHDFKNFGNNWLNLKDAEKTFIFPNFENLDGEVLYAKFADLRNFFKKKGNLLLRTGYKLNYATVYPTPIERRKYR